MLGASSEHREQPPEAPSSTKASRPSLTSPGQAREPISRLRPTHRAMGAAGCPVYILPGATKPQPVSPQPHSFPASGHLPFPGLWDTPQSPTAERQGGNRVGLSGKVSLSSTI